MPSPTHASPMHPQTREHASLLSKKALLVSGLAWCQRFYQGLRSPLMRHQHTPAPWLNDRWDAAHEQVRPLPAGDAMALHALHTRASSRLLLYTLLS
jgi:hypothetical protein